MEHRIIHTGQHYDPAMSGVFFRELEIPAPDYDLGVGSGSHAWQTGEMMKRLEPVLESEKPDWVLVYGDTNSTFAGAAVAAKSHLPLAHLEAGLRSFNRHMPEEINRVAADHLSDLLLCPTEDAVINLDREGLGERTVLVGDVMYDGLLHALRKAEQQAFPVVQKWRSREFALATVHRAENTDDPERLRAILTALDKIADGGLPVLLPVHPRTRKVIETLNWRPQALVLSEPVSYFEMVLLEQAASVILTDSGGVQKEAYLLKRPCITLRSETEWTETLESRCNVLVGAEPDRIVRAVETARDGGPWRERFGNGKAGEAVWRELASDGNAKPIAPLRTPACIKTN